MTKQHSAAAVKDPTARTMSRRSAVKSRDDTGLPARRRSIPDDEAKVRIKTYFEDRHGKTIYPSDVADDLRIEYIRAVRLIEELETDGQVARV
jgi:hypothetical protein